MSRRDKVLGVVLAILAPAAFVFIVVYGPRGLGQ